MTKVANTIYEQLGRARALLGAHTFVADDNSLTFRIKGSPKKIGLICIRLEPTDTYTVEFWEMGKLPEKIHEHSGIYVSELHELIEDKTGLFTC